MEETDPQSPPNAESPLRARLVWLGVLAAFIVLFVLSFNRYRAGANNPNAPDITKIRMLESQAKSYESPVFMQSSSRRRDLLALFDGQFYGYTADMVLRRQLIVEREVDGPHQKELFERIQQRIRELRAAGASQLRPSPEERNSNLQNLNTFREWRQVYGAAPLSRGQALAIINDPRTASLGWFKYWFAAHAYEKIGDKAAAARQRSAAKEAAAASLILMMFTFLGIGAAFLVGIVFLVAMVSRAHKRHRQQPVLPLIADQPVERADTLAIGLLVYLAAVLGGTSLVRRAFPRLGGSGSPQTSLAIEIGIELALAGVAMWWLVKRARFTLRTVGWRTDHFWADVRYGLGAYVASIPVLATSIVLFLPLSPYLPTRPNPVGEEAAVASSWTWKLLLLALACVVAPIVEETFFRGVLFTAMWRRTGKMALAAVGSSLFFALIHPQLIGGAVFLTPLAISMALVYAERASLVPNVVMHATNNAIALILTMYFL